MAQHNRQQLLKEYMQGYEKVQQELKKYPELMWNYKPDAKSWSVKEILIHLVDAEVNSYVRCRKIIAENGTEISPWNQDMWASEIQYDKLDVEEHMHLFRYIRSTNYNLLKETQELVWATHTVTHFERGNITLDDWLEIYVDHIDRHLRQMERVFSQWKKETSNV